VGGTRPSRENGRGRRGRSGRGDGGCGEASGDASDDGESRRATAKADKKNTAVSLKKYK
jgi:hypothetical protein